MNLVNKLFAASSLVATMAVPAFAGVTISTPTNNSDVISPFTVSADASTCSSETVSAMGYSLDSGSDLDTVQATSVDAKISASVGTHTVHIKAWGNNGALCVSDVKVNVTDETAVTASGDTASTTTSIPSDAQSNSAIQVHANWKGVHDAATPGSASGSMSLVGSPSYNGTARRFVTKFSGSGGYRYSDSFGEDTTSSNFVYDGWVFIKSGSKIANLELDLNQVLDNGSVMIYAFQCAGYSGVWEYGSNSGSAKHSHAKWVKSSVACNPNSWAKDTWHHVQIAYSRSSSGNITYKTVTLDGTQHSINKTVFGLFDLSWGHVIQTNFQVDGSGSGESTLYLDDLKVYHW